MTAPPLGARIRKVFVRGLELQARLGVHAHEKIGPQRIRVHIALGWPDESFPANAVVSTRKSVEEATTFVGFDTE